MSVARRSGQPRELVRLSPLQFSLSISIVVVLLGGAGITGYYYGLKQATRNPPDSAGHSDGVQEPKPAQADTRTSVTFYNTLTKPREDVPATPPPRPVVKEPEPVSPPSPEPGIRESVSAGSTIMLQMASYKDVANARKLLNDLSTEGYAGTVVRADLGERGIWFRVRIGPYKGREEANKVLENLRNERKLKGYIVK